MFYVQYKAGATKMILSITKVSHANNVFNIKNHWLEKFFHNSTLIIQQS